MRKYKIRKSLCMLLVLTLLAVSLAGCGRSEAKYTADGKKQIITIGYLPITHALAVFEEKELLDADENSGLQIQLQKFSSWTDLMDALNSGRINGASVLVELERKNICHSIESVFPQYSAQRYAFGCRNVDRRCECGTAVTGRNAVLSGKWFDRRLLRCRTVRSTGCGAGLRTCAL